MRLRLVCAIATMLPIAIDSTASTTSIWLQSRLRAAERLGQQPHGEREGGELRSGADEQRHAGRRALVHVRDPHVERHRAQLEGDADHEERDAEQQADVARTGRRAARAAIAASSQVPVTP